MVKLPCRDMKISKVQAINYRDLIKNIPFLRPLVEENAQFINRIIKLKYFSKGEIILSERETQSYMYIVLEVKVKVIQIGIDGSEQILAIHSKGSFFGEMAILDGKTSPATVIALENSVIGMIYKKDFETYLFKNKKIQMEIYKILCLRLRDAWMKIKILRFTKAEQRLRVTLHLLGLNHGKRISEGILIPIKLTHKDLAALASLSRETVSRKIVKMRRAGELELIDKKQILIKPSFYKNFSI